MFFDNYSKKEIYLNFSSLFIALSILSMVLTTPSEFKALLFAISFMSLIFLKGNIYFLKEILFRYHIFLLFGFLCLLSYFFFSEEVPWKENPKIENILIFIALFIFLNQIQHHYRLIMKYCFYTVSLFLSFSIPLHLFFLESSMLTATAFMYNFEVESYANKNTLGVYLALLFPFLIFQSSKKFTLINLYCVFIFCLSIIFIFSRTALILALLSLLLCFFSYEKRLSMAALFILTGVTFFMWIFEFTPQKYNEMKMNTNVEYFNNYSFDPEKYQFIPLEGARINYLKRSYEGFVQKPFFGNGFASFRNNNPIYDREGRLIRRPVTHNDFTQIAYELGLLGIITLFGMIFINLKSLIPSVNEVESKLMIFQIIILMAAMNAINLLDHILFWFIMAMTYKTYKKQP
jgi:hypothetical protein